ncbi:MAG: sigma 54-interacting transcriptional regulator [Deltaproteobacteria bacterium]|nr:sigma 54-interacting transcriptional regulator [Deltaproteobacteria bacterium]
MGDTGDTLSFHRPPGGPGGSLRPLPQLFMALRCDEPLSSPSRHALSHVDEVLVGRGASFGSIRTFDDGIRRLTVRVPDRWMSSRHARILGHGEAWVLEDADSKNGTILNGAPLRRAALRDNDLFELGHTLFLFRNGPVASSSDASPDMRVSELAPAAPELATFLDYLAHDFDLLAQAAKSHVCVVLQGESGTGKEVVARTVHALSGRTGPFVAVNCGALPETLVETELFGYRKGAFSGAVEDRPGLIRAADCGTLFLDEIGDLPAVSQAAFLRVLQEHEVTPVGGTRPVRVDIRVIAATHRDLAGMVTRSEFRGDLYSRLAGFTCRLPPLRERREDLGLLLGKILSRVAPSQASKVTLSPEAARALFRHEWPMNIRELERCLDAAVVLSQGGHVDVPHLPETVRSSLHATSAPSPSDEPAPDLTQGDARLRDELVELLKTHHGNISAVARAMGKARMQIQRWIKRFGIEPVSFRK